MPNCVSKTLLIVTLILLSGPSCGEKNGGATDVVVATDSKPVEGANLSPLSGAQKQRFEKLADILPSPCGKAHSLRTSRNTDTTCKRAKFAVKYVIAFLEDGASETDIKAAYSARFKPVVKADIEIGEDRPRHGPTDAGVKIVEFFDYGCGACLRVKPMIDSVEKKYDTDVVVYYKQYPLPSHPDSFGAAQAALAAHKQGKFRAMHDLLFANQGAHKMDSLREYAKQSGLDIAQWEADFTEMAAVVEQDQKDGARVNATPTIFINGVRYQGPMQVKYFVLWIEEALS